MPAERAKKRPQLVLTPVHIQCYGTADPAAVAAWLMGSEQQTGLALPDRVGSENATLQAPRDIEAGGK
jgi:hypothetical protein